MTIWLIETFVWAEATWAIGESPRKVTKTAKCHAEFIFVCFKTTPFWKDVRLFSLVNILVSISPCLKFLPKIIQSANTDQYISIIADNSRLSPRLRHELRPERLAPV